MTIFSFMGQSYERIDKGYSSEFLPLQDVKEVYNTVLSEQSQIRFEIESLRYIQKEIT
jgi:hypothetical protein